MLRLSRNLPPPTIILQARGLEAKFLLGGAWAARPQPPTSLQ
jgi:hypothetical protein